MNCCDDNGKCHGGTGCAERPVRSCDELGTCQGRTPPCAGCTPATATTQPLNLAPGAVEGYRVGFFGSPAQRRELLRWLVPSLAFSAVCALAAVAAGVIVARWFA